MKKLRGEQKSCLMVLLKGPQSETRVTGQRLKWVLSLMFFAFAISDALLEVRSLLRDPVPTFEQLEVAEGHIKTESHLKSSHRKVQVITPHGAIGGRFPWQPCQYRSREWADQFEGKQVKIWYVNKRIVQMQINGQIDNGCEYNNSLKVDKEAWNTAIRSFVVDFFAFLVGVYLAILICRQSKSSGRSS